MKNFNQSSARLITRNSQFINRLWLFVLIATLSLPCYGQWYGRQIYSHDSTFLCSAKRTKNTPGYIMAGFRPRTNGSSKDFVIDKVDENGQFSTPNDFTVEYSINSNCAGNTARLRGVDIIENTTPFFSEKYALAGTDEYGFFVALLNGSGVKTRDRYWSFPRAIVGSAGIGNFFKPAITESSSPGKFYVCGAFDKDSAYILKVDASVNPMVISWQYYYAANFLIPRDIIESPYNSSDLIVVGRCDPGPFTTPAGTSHADGFFLKLNSNLGTVTTFSLYHKQFHSDDWFNCIEPADASPASNRGYILGGRCNYPFTNSSPSAANYKYTQWMCRLDANGALIWSSLIEPSGSSGFSLLGGAEISGVYQRNNPTTQTFEHYGVADHYYDPSGTATTNVVVYKLDDSGTTGTITPSEFHFYHASTETLLPHSWSKIVGIESSGTYPFGDGIQVFGTTDDRASHFFAKAYFNGVVGCADAQVDPINIYQGPDSVFTRAVTRTALSSCGGISFTQPSSISPSTVCAASSVGGGDNSRVLSVSQLPTEIEEVYPNPTHGELIIPSTIGQFQIIDQLGKVVYSETNNKPESSSQVLNLNDLGIPPGLYTITSKTSGRIVKLCYLP